MTEPPPTSSAGEVRPGLNWGIALVLAAVVLAVYWPVRHFEFLDYDDNCYVTGNSWVLRGLSPDGIQRAFTTLEAGFWQPLVWLSYLVDATVHGRAPGGFHFSNLLFHAAGTVVLFLALQTLTGSRWRSAVVAALFALHPLHVEPVAWIASRKDVLSALFAFLTLWSYGRYARAQRPARWYALALICFTAGLMCKTSIVTLPLILWLLDWWPLARFSRSVRGGFLLGEKIPFLAVSALTGLATIFAEQHVGAMPGTASPGLRAGIAVLGPVRYLAQTFWPMDLATAYPYPQSVSPAAVAGAAVLLAALSAGLLWLSRTRPYLGAGWLWFLFALLPVSGLVQVGTQAYADRYTYVPLVGIFIAVVWSVAGIVRSRRALGALVAGLAVAACAVAARHQLAYWRDSETLFRRACAVTRDNYIALNNVGLCLFNRGQTDEAIRYYQEAIRANPDHVKSLNNLGNAHSRLGDHAAAIRCFEEALRRKPDLSEAWYGYGNTLLKLGRHDEAIAKYRRALELNPRDATGYNNLGLALTLVHRSDEAVANFQRALAINPDYAGALANLGSALLQRRQFDQAVDCFTRAVRVAPENREMQLQLAGALALAGKYSEAVEQYQRIVQAQPGLAAARIGLGNALAAAGRWEDAALQFREALRSDADNPKTHMRLGIVLEQLGRKPEAVTEFREALRLQPDNEDAARALRRLEESSGQ